MTDQPINPTHQAQKSQNDLVLSYLALRQFLGYLGFVLPSALLLYAFGTSRVLEDSISDFYYTPMGDFLVAVLSAIGVFLLFYKGYQPMPGEWITDRRVGTLAGLGALGVALFPIGRKGQPLCDWWVTDCVTYGSTIHPDTLHYASAAVFFACLAVFCLLLFTKGARDDQGRMMWTPRNRFYVGCGMLILASMLALGVYFLFPDLQGRLNAVNYIFWSETVGVLAFAASWLVKGRAPETLARAGTEMMRKMRQT
jgi:hypothetical protein